MLNQISLVRGSQPPRSVLHFIVAVTRNLNYVPFIYSTNIDHKCLQGIKVLRKGLQLFQVHI